MTEADEKIEEKRKQALKEETALKRRFSLHVNLIAEQEGVTTTQAKFLAWSEGPKGLDKRLSGA